MTASDRALALIKRYEGLRLTAYRCPAGVWTIGYGHTGAVKPGSTITTATADSLLASDVAVVADKITRMADNGRVTLRQCQFDALVSFAFNLGVWALQRSTLWRKVVANPDDPTIAGEFKQWIYAKGARLKGLERRRADEAALYFDK